MALLSACGPSRARPNVILISIDTLRPDHLGCYGYDRETSPHLDGLCEDAVVFQRAIAHAPSTLSSHASLLTSLLPSHHGASVSNSFGLSDKAVTLAEALKEHGYRTASFNGGIQLDPLYGLDRGFDVYSSVRPRTAIAETLRDPVDRFDHVVGRAIEWIEKSPPAPFFLFLHSYEVHHPYTPEPEHLSRFEADYAGSLPADISVELLKAVNRGEKSLDEADLRHVISAYDAEIRSVDEALGRLIDFLRGEGLYDESLVIFTSDHGEEFGEHGVVGWHSHSLFDELLRVPFVLKLPHARHHGRVVERQVRGIDLAPTVLAELGIEPPESFEGRSLISLLESDAVDESSSSEPTVSRRDVTVGNDFPSIRTEEWKWIRGRLFHLGSDPGETVDVAPMHGDVASELERELRELVDSRPRPVPRIVEPDEELLERLRALGYVQ